MRTSKRKRLGRPSHEQIFNQRAEVARDKIPERPLRLPERRLLRFQAVRKKLFLLVTLKPLIGHIRRLKCIPAINKARMQSSRVHVQPMTGVEDLSRLAEWVK